MAQCSYLTPTEDTRRVRRVLTEPLLLKPGEPLVDLDLIVPADFRRTAQSHAIVAHPSGLKIRNCRILFETDAWLDRWQIPLGEQPLDAISSYASALNLAGTANVDIDGLHVEGSPRFAIEAWDVLGMRLKRFSATRCYQGAHFGERPGGSGNRGWQVEDVRIWDLWGGPDGYPSRVRPGGWVGGDGWVSEGDKIRLSRFDLSGEMFFGAKICRGSMVILNDFATPTLMLQGSSGPDPALQGLTWLAINGLYINAATGYGLGADGANKLQVSWNVTGQIRGGYIVGNGKDGCAIQATGNVHLDVRGLTIAGFNGQRGGLPACALELDVRPPPQLSTINDDFETANQFENQQRILRRAA